MEGSTEFGNFKRDETFNLKSESFTGNVVKQLVAQNSKSEHQAIMLVTEMGTYLLRRRDGNPFFDPVLEKLKGKRIRCIGVKKGNILYLDTWHILNH